MQKNCQRFGLQTYWQNGLSCLERVPAHSTLPFAETLQHYAWLKQRCAENLLRNGLKPRAERYAIPSKIW
jgi:hypothetical protein